MKQVLLFLLFLTLCVDVLVCQTEFGLKIGYNLSNTDYGRNAKSETTPGYFESKNLRSFHFGVTSDFNLKNKFDLNIEVFLIGKGLDGRPNTTFSLLNTNLALPIVLKYEIYPKVVLSAGLEANYTFNYYWVEGFNYTNVDELFENRRKINFGGVFGVGYKISNRWTVDFRYVRIFRDTPQELTQIYNRTYMFSVHRYFAKKI